MLSRPSQSSLKNSVSSVFLSINNNRYYNTSFTKHPLAYSLHDAINGLSAGYKKGSKMSFKMNRV
ncbi:conserved hypothetical protein [Helicobacter pylori B8]|uniref:Uncharacterized protein n=1 Tax=Helicobacter pylori (strain B8) TaxID=693745 RepID=D7FCN3_HELP3|nr:conserved hypothetical protein [Helicobacter pylori B8]